MKKILAGIPNYSRYCASAKEFLEANGCVVVENETGGPLSPDQMYPYLHDIDAAVAGVEVWDQEAFDRAPALKVLARFGVGVDNIDLEAAKARGIVVTNCPGLNARSVAEHTMMLMLSLLREGPQLNQDTRCGHWRRLMVSELAEKTVGLLGYGAVAKRVALYAKAFGSHVIAYDKYPDVQSAASCGVELCSLEEVLRASDILSVHVPALEETYHILGEEALNLTKDGVYIVNTSRGSNVDEAAVLRALQAGKVAGFASDVFEFEPVSQDYPLFQCSNYICTPHVAAESYENYYHTGMKTAQAILAVLHGTGEVWNRLV